MPTRQNILMISGLWSLMIAIVFYAYLPALGSGLQFDDLANLGGLSGVVDTRTAIDFTFSGKAGPTGRPLALATFLPHAQTWPYDLTSVLLANIMLHLVNGLLVGLLAFLLARYSPAFVPKARAGWAALAIAFIWLCLPLLASTNIMIVQRMTTLAAFFVLLGLIFHLVGRSLVPQRPLAALVLVTLGVATGLGLGILSKENAVVYPLLVLTLDRTLLKGLPSTPLYSRWRALFIVLPAILLATYMAQRFLTEATGQGTALDFRHFSMLERILTQAVILFDYLRQLLIPQFQALGPFHDHYPLYGGLPLSIAVALLAFWIVLVVVAVAFGPRWPIPTFAALWFLAGHSLESTWLPLELYFEHRNYLPAVGVIVALVFALGQMQGRRGSWAYAGFGIYGGFLLVLLFHVTSLWGNPRIAAEVWQAHNPESVRAARFLALQHDVDGSPLIAAGVLDQASQLDRQRLDVQLLSLRLHCIGGNREHTLELRDSILRTARDVRYERSRPDHDAMGLEFIFRSIQEEKCVTLDYSDVDRIAIAFMENPIVQGSRSDLYRFLAIRARIANANGDVDKMMELGTSALEQDPVLRGALSIGQIAAQEGRADLIIRILVSLESQRPRHPIHLRRWQEVVDELTVALRSIESSTQE